MKANKKKTKKKRKSLLSNLTVSAQTLLLPTVRCLNIITEDDLRTRDSSPFYIKVTIAQAEQS